MKTVLTKTQTNFLNQNTKGTWKLNHETGLVDIEGDFGCKLQGLKDFKGIKFGVVTESFDCGNNQLTSLVGAPQKVRRFDCGNNQLTSLVGAPQEVGGDFHCDSNKITSLVGAPQEVGGDFHCDSNKITSLEGAPQKVGGYLYCHNNKLTSLEGAPQEVGGHFSCFGNPVPQEVLNMIWGKMRNGTPYYIALASLKSQLIKSRSKNVKNLVSQIDDGVAKGASLLGRFEVI